MRYAINHDKITKDLSWKPKIKLDEGLKKTVKWYLDNNGWLNNIMTKEYLTYYETQYKNR